MAAWYDTESNRKFLATAQAGFDSAMARANNTALPASERVKAKREADGWKRQIDASPISKANFAKEAYEKKTKQKLTDMGLAAPAEEAAAAPALAFGGPAQVLPNQQPAAANPHEAMLTQMFPGLKITSAGRTPEKNAKVNGVKNSMHLIDPRNPNGQALDFVLADMTPASRKAAVDALKATGMFTEVLDETGRKGHNPHIHVGWRPTTGQATPTVTAQQVAQGGLPVSFLDPSFAMSMVPAPRTVGKIDLPNAPQREMPGDMPMLEEANKEAVLAQLASVIQPKERDGSFDSWDRIAAMLQGAAQGMAHAGPGAGLGQMLLMAGAGGAGGFRSEAKEQKAEKEAHDEKVRQAQIVLAKMGIDIDLSNLTTRNSNKDRTYKSGEDKKDVKFSNANATFQAQVQEMLTNLGITQNNIQALNAADNRRAEVGLGAMTNAIGAQNSANASVVASGQGAAANQDKAIDSMMVEAGLQADDSKNPLSSTARGTAAAIIAGDVNGALQNMAQELVMTGAAAQILAPDKGDTPEAAATKQAALKALKQAKKATDPGAQQAAQMLAQLMASNHAAALAIAQAFSTSSPSARLIISKNNAKAK